MRVIWRTASGNLAGGGRQAASVGYWLTGARGGREVVQNKVPKIDAETLKPCKWPANPGKEWCPPGHGDLYPALAGTGMLDKLLEDGVKYMFVSNSDNLGATLDLQLLDYFAEVLLPCLLVSRSAAPCPAWYALQLKQHTQLFRGPRGHNARGLDRNGGVPE